MSALIVAGPWLGAVAAYAVGPASPDTPDSRPNFVVIYTDDHRFDALGVAGRLTEQLHAHNLAPAAELAPRLSEMRKLLAAEKARIVGEGGPR